MSRKFSTGMVNVEPLSHKTFLFAYRIIEKTYGGGTDVLHELTMADEGIVLYDGVVPIGVCLIRYGVVDLDFPLVMDCVVLDEYKETKWSIRMLRELKRLLRGAAAYYIIYGGDEYVYKGEKNSIEAIVKTKAIKRVGNYTLIRNR